MGHWRHKRHSERTERFSRRPPDKARREEVRATRSVCSPKLTAPRCSVYRSSRTGRRLADGKSVMSPDPDIKVHFSSCNFKDILIHPAWRSLIAKMPQVLASYSPRWNASMGPRSRDRGNEKSWDQGGDACPECQDNAGAGWIPFDEDFPSGDDSPPAHPNCDCALDIRGARE